MGHGEHRTNVDPVIDIIWSVGGEQESLLLQLRALAYNLGNFKRTLAMPQTAEPWSLPSLCEKRIKIGAKVVSGRWRTFCT